MGAYLSSTNLTTDSLVSTPVWRPVRIGMAVNGVTVGGLKSFTVTNSNFFTCDKWSAVIGLQGAPSGYGAAFWSIQTGIEVDLSASLTDGGALLYVTGGYCDKVRINLAEQEMTIEGRDYTAPLIDSTTNEKFTNQTSGQVANTLATRRGLIPVVTKTSLPIGRYFDNSYAAITDDVSEFRLLSFLAQQEGFDLYAVGKSLYFGPPQQDKNPLVLTYQYATSSAPIARLNAPNIELAQDKVIADTVTVDVRSWNYQSATPIIATWQTQKTQKMSKAGNVAALSPSNTYTRAQVQGGIGAKGPVYSVRKSGLTQAQADELAKKTLSDICSNERTCDASGLPAIIGIDSRRTLRLVGTGTSFDQDYDVAEISRTFSWDGAVMSIHGKSSSPQTLITV